MRNCIGLTDLLCAYADGELPEANIQTVEDHLAICDNCSAVLKIYKEIGSTVNDTNVRAPEALRIGVMNRIQSEHVPRKATVTKQKMKYRKILTRYTPIAAGLVVMLLVWQFWGDMFGTRSFNTMGSSSPPADTALAPMAAMSADVQPEMIEDDHDDGAPQAGGGAGGISENEEMSFDTTDRSSHSDELHDEQMTQWFHIIDGFELTDGELSFYFNNASAIVSIIGEMPVFLSNYQPVEKSSWDEWWIQSGWDELYEIPSSEISILLHEIENREGAVTALNSANAESDIVLVVFSRGA